MSLSWKDEATDNHGLAPINKFKYSQTYGDDIKLDYTPVRQSKPDQRPVVEVRTTEKEIKKKSWLLRPVAWLVLLISVYLMNAIINMFFLTGTHVVDWLSTLPTVAVTLLTLAFGSFSISLMFYGAFSLVGLVVTTSQSIYPSQNGVRFYIVGAEQLIISFLEIVLTIADAGSAHTFLDFAAPIYFAIVYIVMLCSVKSLIS